MLAIVRLFGVIAFASAVVWFWLAFSAPDAELVFYIGAGLTSLLSGAMLFCFALIAETLLAIRETLERR